jgi:uncharacterized protein (DUF885 family)
MNLNRREWLRGVAGLATVGSIPAIAASAASVGNDSDARLRALLQRQAEAWLRRSPEEATRSEFDTAAHSALRYQLDDRSLDAIARDRRAVDGALRELSAIDRASLSPQHGLDYDVAAFVYRTLKDQLARYGYVDINLRPSPYVVSQMNGAYYWLPDFIGTDHPLKSSGDVEAWFARLAALGKAVDQETERIAHDARLGVVLPDFTLARTVAQIKGLRDTPPAQTAIIGPALERARKQGLGDLSERATAAFRQAVVPALGRQIVALEGLRPKAVSEAGVWRLPDGEAYYKSAVRSNTTASIVVPELHRLGLQQVADITARLDKALRAQGYSKGNVGDRIEALNQDPRFLAPDDDAGREKLLSAARGMLQKITARLPKAFRNIPQAPLEVRRMPVAIENGSPGAFYSEGVGGQPGVAQSEEAFGAAALAVADARSSRRRPGTSLSGRDAESGGGPGIVPAHRSLFCLHGGLGLVCGAARG